MAPPVLMPAAPLLTKVQVPSTEVSAPVPKRAVLARSIKRAPSLKWDYRSYIDGVNEGNIVSAKIRQDQREVTVITVDGKNYHLDLPDGYDSINFLMNAGVDVSVEKVASAPPIVGIGVMLIQLAMLRFVFNAMGGKNNFGKIFSSTNKKVEKVSTKFSDVAGAHAAKRDLAEVVDFLRNPEVYEELGARVPRGILLTGAPGCGKSLLARSVAGEAGVPFFSVAASEFMQMFVGAGAGKVRALFAEAERVAPSIIFIDEIDSIGKERNNSINSDEREQTLNQLLVCMDGFESGGKGKGVIVLAATNRPDILDEALTRPGRFDRIVEIPDPDLIDRESILMVHSRNKQLASDVNLATIARNTAGFSGAALANLANEAALMAARNKHAKITMNDWTNALDKVLLGEVNVHQAIANLPGMDPSTNPAIVFAYHEAGHALMSILSTEFDDIRKVSIISRGRAGGVTLFDPVDSRDTLYTREYLENQITVGLAGRAAEELIFGKNKMTTGAQGDFQRVTSIAYDMIATYGFGSGLGIGAWNLDPLTDSVGGIVSDEVKSTLDYCYKQAFRALQRYEPFLHRIATALMKSGTISLNDIREILAGISCTLPPNRQR
jgi:cell division protease FtsH